MSKKYVSRIIAVIILFAFPFGFYFYYKKKLEDLPGKKAEIQTFWKAPSFKYATQNGDSLSAESLRGNIYVADFIFTSCRSVCPDLSKTMAQVQDNFKDVSQVKLLSFSIDPDRDSIPVLKDYSERYGAIAGKWYFLKGDKHVVWSMAEDGFKIPVVYTPEGGQGGEFTHSEKLVLVDDQGMIRGFYNGLDAEKVKQLHDDISQLIVPQKK